MTTYAVISLAGKQHVVKVGDKLTIDRLAAKEGDSLTVSNVLLVAGDGDRLIGTPTVNQSVTAKVIEHTKGDKIRVATYRAKSRYRKVKGHRQAQSVIEITAIGKASKEPAKKETKSPKKTTPRRTKT